MGVRRGGKSTLLKQLINHLIRNENINPRNILFLNLETPYFSHYRDDPINLEKIYDDYQKLTSPEGKIYFFLDEVQYFNEWQVFVKAHYEQKNIKFVITGSNSNLLSSELITLLSGRSIPVEVYPFSYKEFLKATGLDTSDSIALIKKRNRLRRLLDDYLKYGGFPEIVLMKQKEMAREILSMYSRNIIYQDIAARYTIRKAADLEHLFFYLISNISALYSYNNLSGMLNLSDKTVKEYLKFFSDAYLLFTVDSFSHSVKQQLKSPKKIYSIDTGIIGAVSFRFSENIGKLLENMVFLEMKRLGKDIYYYKTENGFEVDFLCRRGGETTELIQVAKEIRISETRERELRAMFKALKENNINEGYIVTYENEEEIVKKDNLTVNIIPSYK